jgi:biotin synthase
MSSTSTSRYESWRQAGLADQSIDRSDALSILSDPDIDLMALLSAAGAVRRHFFGNTVTIHVLENVRNGACPEDCGYCGQSKDSDAPVQPYKIKSVDEIVDEARHARDKGAYRYCMALSGRGPSDRDVDHMCDAIRRIKDMGLRTCLSIGLLQGDQAQRLADAGLDRLNHNLNTSRSHYSSICTTHTFDDRLDTLRQARDAGIGLCSGLILGMDETHEDLLELAFTLRQMRSESIPVNFLLPIDGNRVNNPRSGGAPLTPRFCLRALCMFRLVNPTAEVRMAAGRELHLRSLQPLGLEPANSLFMDGYLLTQGSGAGATLSMILEAGLKPIFEHPAAVPPELLALIEHGESNLRPAMNAAGSSSLVELQLKPSVAKKPRPAAMPAPAPAPAS